MRIRTCNTGTQSRSTGSLEGGIHANCFEILYITAGRAKFQWTGNCCEAEAPALFLISPTTPHLLESAEGEINYFFMELVEAEEHFLTTVNVDRWNFMQAQQVLSSKTLFTSPIQQSLDFILYLFRNGALKQYEEIEHVCQLEIQKIFKLITPVLHSTFNPSRSSGRTKKWSAQETVDILINYMEWKYREDITLKMLADRVHLNPSYLIRVFKEHTQYTPFEYLQNLRIKAAVSYLEGSNLPLKTIVTESGFNSIHYFCRLFKKIYGESPVRWRNQLNKKEA